MRSNTGQLNKDTRRKLKSTSKKALGSEEKCCIKLPTNFVYVLISKQREERRKTNLVKKITKRKDHVNVRKKDGVKVYEQKRYLLWKIRDLHETTNGGSVIEEAGGDSFSNAFGRPMKIALPYDVLKLHKEYVFNRDIPQWSCLCELCQNVILLATSVYKVLKDKLATSHHDIVEKFSCSSSKHCMHDACCEICSSIDINILDNMEITESQNEGSTDNNDDYHDD